MRYLASRHDRELAFWLEQGWARYLAGLPLDEALELRGLRARNAALRRAAALLDPEHKLSITALARRLEGALDWFERHAPRLGDREVLRDPLQVALYDARFALPGRKPPAFRQLVRLLQPGRDIPALEMTHGPGGCCGHGHEQETQHDPHGDHGPAVHSAAAAPRSRLARRGAA